MEEEDKNKEREEEPTSAEEGATPDENMTEEPTPEPIENPLEPSVPTPSDEGHQETDEPKKSGFRFKHNSFLGLLTHVVMMVLASAGIVLCFFFLYLPNATNHGNTISVPNLNGISLDSAKTLLSEMGLRVEIYDSSATHFTTDVPPLTILDQDPRPDDQVKLNRKIYLTVNPVLPPMVDLPDVLASSVKNTQIRFKSLKLKMKIEYVNGEYPNTVEKIFIDGTEITKEMIREGHAVPKGTEVLLHVNNGVGKERFVTIPNLVGMPLDEAEWLLMGMGLAIGKISYVDASEGFPKGTVVLQNPTSVSERNIQIGSSIAVSVAREKVEVEEKASN